jgi:hypothetical protein
MTDSTKQSGETHAGWIASSQVLLAMTVKGLCRPLSVIASEAKQSSATLEDLLFHSSGPGHRVQPALELVRKSASVTAL